MKEHVDKHLSILLFLRLRLLLTQEEWRRLEIAIGMIAQPGRDLRIEFKGNQIHAVEREVIYARIGIAAEARVRRRRVRH